MNNGLIYLWFAILQRIEFVYISLISIEMHKVRITLSNQDFVIFQQKI